MIPSATRRPRRPRRGLVAVAAAAIGPLATVLAGCAGLPGPEPVAGPAPLEPVVVTATEQARLEAANEAKDDGDYETALLAFQRILAENPTVTEAYLGVGDIRLELDQPELAEPAFRRATVLEPRNFDAHYKHGRALRLLGRMRDAVLAFQRAVTVEPDDFEANRDLATALLDLGRVESAAEFARKAVALRPEDGPARLNLGAIESRRGDNAAAIQQYLAALELIGNDPRILENLVYALAAERRYREAVNTGRQLVRTAPSADVYERLGWCHFKLREYEASEEAYRAALDLDPNHWPSLNGVGVNALNAWLLSGGDAADQRTIAGEAFRQSLRLNADQQPVINLLIEYRL